jgi:hypothetical protein
MDCCPARQVPAFVEFTFVACLPAATGDLATVREYVDNGADVNVPPACWNRASSFCRSDRTSVATNLWR